MKACYFSLLYSIVYVLEFVGVSGVSSGMRGSRKFCQMGPKSDKLLIFDEGRENPNATKWPNIECWLGSFPGDPVHYC